MLPFVLVVEDNADLRLLYRMALKNEGYDVRVAKHGEEALEILNTADQKPKLIILDLMMPVMDGWEFLKRKEADKNLSPIPVVVCSASKDNLPENVLVLRKPLDLHAVLELAGRYCNGA